MATDAIAVAENLALALFQYSGQHTLQLTCHRLEIHTLVGTAVVAGSHHVNHGIVIVIATKWSVNTHVVIVSLDGLVNLALLHLGNLCQLGNRRLALVLLLELADFGADLAQRTHLVQRQANDTALLSDGLENALANPPHCV